MIELLRIRGEYGSDADQLTHTRILEAIANRDAESAATLTRDHLVALKEKLR